ncbi:MAG: outer membrane lipoprotein-sorting protein [Planctomycetota bacterium]
MHARSNKMKNLTRGVRALGAASIMAVAGLTGATVIAPVATASVLAQDLTTADEVIDRSIEKSWGEWAKDRPETTRKMTGTMEIPAAGITASIQVTFKSPDKLYMMITIPNFGDQTRGSDGDVFWETSTMQGPRVIEGVERDQLAREADFYSELDYKETYPTREFGGTKDLDGEQVYVVTLTPEGEDATPQTRYYSIESGLLVRMDAVQSSQMGEMQVVTRMRDYREVDGLKVPFETEIEIAAMGMKQIVKFDSVEHGVEVDDSIFAPPAEVKEIMGDGEG